MFRQFVAIAFVACLALQASALSTITVKGAKFFAGGQQFFLKGKVSPSFQSIYLTMKAWHTKALQPILSSIPSNVN
tara:strand:- start:531 stop:758 length:228 start_codon:yes stop_codon:yes gene_type:complete